VLVDDYISSDSDVMVTFNALDMMQFFSAPLVTSTNFSEVMPGTFPWMER
jgi:hypothetical protein